jgi:hypothetical protein
MVFMKNLLKMIIVLIILATVADGCKYLYKIITAAEPYRSANPFFVSTIAK